MTTSQPYIEIEGLAKTYGQTLAVAEFSLDVAAGEMVILLGPSGCGKTTTLRMLAGFVEATRGSVRLAGRNLLSLPPYQRNIGIVFQNYALFPHMNTRDNIAFGLKMRRMSATNMAARIDEVTRLVKLDGLLDRYPRQLSGGQQQRVALARALAIHPGMLLLDEPLSNLDAELRLQVSREIRLVQQEKRLTSIMVTHDQSEAMAMADRLVVMSHGRVCQIGTQTDLYESPATPFVARFIGQSNLISGTLREGMYLHSGTGAHIRLAGRYSHSGICTVAIRPERICISSLPDEHGEQANGVVQLASNLGAIFEYDIRLPDGSQIIVRDSTSAPHSSRHFTTGEPVSLSWEAKAERVFDEQDKPIASLNGVIDLRPGLSLRPLE